jgi:hypothetical protein
MGHRDRTKKVEDERLARLETVQVVEEAKEICLLRDIKGLLQAILHFVGAAKGFKIYSIIGGVMQADIKPTVKGTIAHFTSTLDPAGSLGQANLVPKWATTNPLVTLSPSTDGFAVDAATTAADTAAGYDLTESGFDDKGNPISTTVQVAYAAATGVSATGFDIKSA